MTETRLLVFCSFFVAAGCGSIDTGSDADASAGDHRDSGGGGGGGGVADASGPDATPVDCDGPEDCANPDDPCLLPGTCEGNVCSFPAKDCGELDGECSRGVCADNGECEARPIRQDMACGDGVMDCGPFAACSGFGDTCDESGSQGRACTDSTCQAGECVTSEPYVDTRSCARDTDGVTCAASAVSCDFCGYSSTCDRTAPPAACSRTDHTCANQTCGSSTVSLPDQSCDRDTECNSCTTIPGGQPGSCSVNGTCGAQCQ
jgi:hypothetical protein